MVPAGGDLGHRYFCRRGWRGNFALAAAARACDHERHANCRAATDPLTAADYTGASDACGRRGLRCRESAQPGSARLAGHRLGGYWLAGYWLAGYWLAGTSEAVACDTDPWGTVPVTVTGHAAVPPVPVVMDVRTAAHSGCGYDRLVVDISGTLPGYSVRYVHGLVTDESGRSITLPGQRDLLIVLKTAQAHTSAGALTLSRQVHLLRYPALTSWVLAGDFEGVVRLAVGLSGLRPVRVSELPGRVVVDFRQ